MALPSLLDLPVELREQIYNELFSSATGYVALDSSLLEKTGRFSFFEYEPRTKRIQGDAFSLSILRTCKTIYSEASRIFWKRNMLALWQRELFCYGLERVARRRVFSHVEQVYLDLDLMRREELYWTKLSLGELAVWASEGVLRSVTLNVADDWRELAKLVQLNRFGEARTLYGLPNETAGDMLFHEYIEAFSEVVKGPLAHVERKIALRAGVTGWPMEPKEALEKLVASPDDFGALLVDMKSAWGGELSLDGISCFRESVEVELLFGRLAITGS